jgi:choline dehydrogenase
LLEFDYIVVGAGSAGCALVEKLTADGRHRVALIEAGGGDRRFWIRTPIGYGRTFDDARVNWKFTTAPDPGTGGRSAYWPRGKVLGGSSSINAMVYCRGLPADYDDWAAAGNPGWSWRELEPIFKSYERKVGRNGDVEGDGPLWVCDREREYHPLKRHLYSAARELGFPVVDDLNQPAAEGVAAYAINTRKGLRCSSADAFLRPSLRRDNLTLITESLVDRIVIRGRRAVGVTFQRDGKSEVAHARAEIILAAGAVNSPKLLQLSGIGPGALLSRHGIEVVRANDAVGGGLQDHLGISYFYRATEPTLNNTLGTWRGCIAAGLRFLFAGSGALSLSVNQIGGLVKSNPGRVRPDLQLYFNPLSYQTTVKGRRRLTFPDPWPGFIFGFNACRPTSRGRIDIPSADPQAPPTIAPNYLATQRDVEDVVAGARLIGRFEQTAAMRGLIDGKPQFDLARASDEDIVADFRARSGTVFHPCGTCRMAPESDDGVVDPSLRVHGLEALRVADASIFPNITSANTNAPAILVGRKAAELVLAS